MEPADRQARDGIARRLRDRFPDLASDVLERHLEDAYRHYDDAQVRHFLPILIEREVVERVRGSADSAPAL